VRGRSEFAKVKSEDAEMLRLESDDGSTDGELVGIGIEELEEGDITTLLAVEDRVSE
jgi:hypothetical protein